MIRLKKVLKIILKNFLALICGAVFGAAILLIFLKPILYAAIPKDAGLAVIALAPALLVIYGIIFTIGGGILAVILYNLILILKKLRKGKK